MRDILAKYKGRTSVNIFSEEKRDASLVEVLAYSLMPNHIHLILRQKAEGGITSFLRRVSTGYTMYFNTKYDHSGVLFQGSFKSKHINSDSYFRYIFTYTHLNSLSLIEPEWETRGIQDMGRARDYVNSYPYSSFGDYSIKRRPESALLSFEQAPTFLTTQNDLEELLATFTEVRPL
jgi:REP element-mobilizing transposase RayT